MEFTVLGAVEAWHEGNSVPLGGPQRRGVLALLLLHAGNVVSLDRFAELVWCGDPPTEVRSAVRMHVSRLRSALARDPEVTIAAQHPGYVLRVDPERVDVHRFRGLVTAARATSDPDRSRTLLGAALSLWRGTPLADLPSEQGRQRLCSGLDEERLSALEKRIELDLRLGRHETVVAELAELATEHPLRERFTELRMLAMYRCGRQADALDQYQLVRTRLTEELGTDPCPTLQRLYQRILTADPALNAPAVTPGRGATGAPVPRQLPAAPRIFTGRTRELAALTEALDTAAESGTTMVISAIGGTAGVGKTSLALHWAHQHVDRFPDGQLHVNLRGFDPSGDPTSPATAVRGFLDALGADPAAIPFDLDAQAALYRSLVAGKHMLILLDNAADTSQITHLIPGSPTCAVLITSRRQLVGLITTHGAHTVDLDVLTDAEAQDLLARHVGAARVAAETDAVTELVACCSGLPLALSITAARASSNPGFPLAMLAEELRDDTTRLDTLDTGDPQASLRAVLSRSYHAITPHAATMFGLLGVAPGPDISLSAAASLTGLPPAHVSKLVRELETAHLIQQPTPGRYRMHDLIRLYATDQAHRHQPESQREAALRRLVDFYLHSAGVAAARLEPHRHQDAVEASHPPASAPVLDGYAPALAWMNGERTNILAVIRAAADHSWYHPAVKLSEAFATFLDRRGHWHDFLSTQEIAMDAAERLGDRQAQARCYRLQALAHARLGHTAEAHACGHEALSEYRELDDIAGQAETHFALASVYARCGQPDDAFAHARLAMALYRQIGERSGEGTVLGCLGMLYAQRGDLERAVDCSERALLVQREAGNRIAQAAALFSLGYVHRRIGNREAAVTYFEQASSLHLQLGYDYEAAVGLQRLAEMYQATGKRAASRHAWRQALTILEKLELADAAKVRGKLAELDRAG